MEETIFVYDAIGKLVGEYSNEVASSQEAAVAYLTDDHLGSARIHTDVNGNVTARHDYRPFGEEISSSKRDATLGYANEAVRKQFTSYERDKETGLDFAEARMLASWYGRFSSPDPYNVVFKSKEAEMGKEGEGKKVLTDYLFQPQNWNRYVYVWNNPLANIDPDGQKVYVIIYTAGNSEGDEEFKRAAETLAQAIQKDGKFDPAKDKVVLLPVVSKKDLQKVFDIAKTWGQAGYG